MIASREFQWKGNSGARALDVVLPLPARSAVAVRMAVRPKEEVYTATFETALDDASVRDESEEKGRIMAVKSMPVGVSGKGDLPTGMAERTFGAVHIWEETGESIARHIWYAYEFGTSLPPLHELTSFQGRGISLLRIYC